MGRMVQGGDGREWSIRTEMEWRKPATADDFEHDVAGGYIPAAVMIVVALLLSMVLVVWLVLWRPDVVVIPYWVPLILVLIALFFPTRWVLRRPWKVVAETAGSATGRLPAERWVGTVRGMAKVPAQVSRIKQDITRNSEPNYEGILRKVD